MIKFLNNLFNFREDFSLEYKTRINKKHFEVEYSIYAPTLVKKNIVFRFYNFTKLDDDKIKRKISKEWKVDEDHIIIHEIYQTKGMK